MCIHISIHIKYIYTYIHGNMQYSPGPRGRQLCYAVCWSSVISSGGVLGAAPDRELSTEPKFIDFVGKVPRYGPKRVARDKS